jgi:hypothetical protein
MAHPQHLWDGWNQVRMHELSEFVRLYNERKLPSTPSIGAIPFIHELNSMIKHSKTKCDLPTLSFNYDKNYLLDVHVIHLDTKIGLSNLFTSWTTTWYKQAQALPGFDSKVNTLRLETRNITATHPAKEQIATTKQLTGLENDLRDFYEKNLKNDYIAHRSVLEMGQVI